MKVNKQKIITGLQYVGIFLIYFIVQYRFLNVTWFGTDELDVMAGGKAIASGYQLYGDFLSQHMPFSYYLSAVFDALGATSVVRQRIAFYLFYAFMWTIIYGRYQKTVNKYALLLYPICFSGLVSCYDWGSVILSEHLAGIGFVILFLEYINFYKNRKLGISNYIAISISIMLTFGTIFIAIFGVFAIAVAVLAREIQWQVREKKKFSVFMKEMLRKYIPLACCVAVPWVILGIYYIIHDNLRMSFLSAYVINREVYPKYVGYGDNIGRMFFSGITYFYDMVRDILNVPNINFSKVVQTIAIVAIVLFITKIFEKKQYLFGGSILFFLMELGVRGYFFYHGTQWVAVTSLIMTIVFCDVLIESREKFSKKSLGYRSAVIICTMIIAGTFLGDIANVMNRQWTVAEEETKLGDAEKYTRDIVVKITEEDEAIWQLSFSNYVTMTADRPAIGNVGGTPWMWEKLGIYTLAKYGDTPPRVAIYYRDHNCWGFPMADYAPELVAYMDEHYTQYDGTEIYIRNDYYEEACSIIQEGN